MFLVLLFSPPASLFAPASWALRLFFPCVPNDRLGEREGAAVGNGVNGDPRSSADNLLRTGLDGLDMGVFKTWVRRGRGTVDLRIDVLKELLDVRERFSAGKGNVVKGKYEVSGGISLD